MSIYRYFVCWSVIKAIKEINVNVIVYKRHNCKCILNVYIRVVMLMGVIIYKVLYLFGEGFMLYGDISFRVCHRTSVGFKLFGCMRRLN